ncbi:oxalate:formate antiporter [Clostridium sp. A1-XYC3]|uniref:Oxalate:formate antiporter n=1 Tax=Clostridium tanneri TaxID=3037988 RepID=A0ABU4JTM2_9CLOT|nr:oxalate:formate antiporter [Clostridium sp. A1-XYC3]MDW8801495.1 oxalate:formate antiporter [Clostridium sp. A1-XYC3]
MIPKIHQDFIDKTIQLLKYDCRILGVAAGGSYITNSLDEFSDIDLIIAVESSCYEQIMKERKEIAGKLGNLLSAFTGEHVGEPRLLICLYGPPLLHVDLKFVALADIGKRVEDPVILWERDNAITDALKLGEAKFPAPDLQWIEDRFWVWIHYGTVKIGRGEIFEAIEFISFMRQTVIGPLLLMKNGKLPRGVRKIETDAPNDLFMLKETIATYDAKSCVRAIQGIIRLYVDLRDQLSDNELIRRSEAEKYTKDYLNEIRNRLTIHLRN